METKVCSRCLREKVPAEFNKDQVAKNGLSSMCKACNKINCRIYYQKDIEKHRLLARFYYSEHKEQYKRYRLLNREKNKEYQSNYRAQRKHYLNLLGRQRRERLRVKQGKERILTAETEAAQLKLVDV